MSTLSELRQFVRIEISDHSISDDDINNALNAVLKKVAGGVVYAEIGNLSPPLPELLKTDGEIDADYSDAFVDMPDDYQRDLIFCRNSTEKLIVNDSFLDFMNKYPTLDDSGGVSEVCVQGRKFYYQGLPTTYETLYVHYYRYPDTLSDDSDTPEGIPERLHKDILVPGACDHLTPSDHPKKSAWIMLVNKGIADLVSIIGRDEEAVNMDDDTEYCD